MPASRKLSEAVFLDTSFDKRQMSSFFKHKPTPHAKISVSSHPPLARRTKMSSVPVTKPSPIISLNHYIFSGIRTKPSRDDIYKKILIPRDMNRSGLQQRGFFFVWPQKRSSFFYHKELVWLTWFLAHTLYWLHVVDILPTGAAVPFKQPPWKYEPPLYRPKSRDFIIEPDWESYRDHGKTVNFERGLLR